MKAPKLRAVMLTALLLIPLLVLIFVIAPPKAASILSLLVFAPLLGAVTTNQDSSKVYQGGGNAVAVFLTNANATAIFGSTVLAGWLLLGQQESSNWGPDRDTEEVTNEAGTVVITRENTNLFTITVTFQQTDDTLFKILKWMEGPANARPIRMALPTNDGTKKQWFFGRSAYVRKENWRTEASTNAIRTRTVTFVLQPDPLNTANNGAPEIGPMTLGNDQTQAEWSTLNDFKDTRVTT